jgi:hypothetical protein
MNCRQVEESLVAYLDNQLPRQDWLAIRRHLGVCSGCREALEQVEYKQSCIRQVFKNETDRCSNRKDVWPLIHARIVDKGAQVRKAPGFMGWLSDFQDGLVRFLQQHRTIRIAAASMAVVTIASFVTLGVPWLNGQHEKASAAEAVLNSPEFQATLAGREPGRLDVKTTTTGASGHKFIVLSCDQPNLYIVAEMEKETEKVIQLFVLEINEELKETISNIALADSRVQELITQGGSLLSFSPSFWAGSKTIEDANGDRRVLGPIGFSARLTLDVNSHLYYAKVDLDYGTVGEIMPLQTSYFYFATIKNISTVVVIGVGIILFLLLLRKKLSPVYTGLAAFGLGILANAIPFISRLSTLELFLLGLTAVSALGLGIASLHYSTTRISKVISWPGIILGTIGCLYSLAIIFLYQNPPNTYYF